jgi:hypothetical protein
VLSKIKLGRVGTVEDLTGAILFLASDASAPDDGRQPGDRWRTDGGASWGHVR